MQEEVQSRPNAGTPGYEAPEVISGGSHSRLSDSYSVGKALPSLLGNTAAVAPILEVAEKLTLNCTSARWSLEHALSFLGESHTKRNYVLPLSESPPHKQARIDPLISWSTETV